MLVEKAPLLRRSLIKRALTLAFLCLIGLVPTQVFASSTDLFGLGARGAAMGGAVVSNVSGFASVYYNPAALMVLGQRQFTVGGQRADYGLELNEEGYAVDEAMNLVLGFNVPIPFGGVLADRIAFGLGFVIPFASILEADVRAPETPVFILVENRARVIGLHASLSVKILDWLFVGGGVVALAELIGGIDIAPNDQGQLGSTVRDELVADYAPIVGLLIEPTDWFSFGVAFHGASDARFTFPVTADLGSGFPVDVPTLDIAGIAQFDPANISSDVTIRPVEGFTLAAGVTFKLWSEFENPIINTTEPVPEQDPAGFIDVWVPRLGAEYELTLGEVELALRTGGYWEGSPVLQQVANHNYLDSSRLGIGLGAGVLWRGITFDMALQAQFMSSRTHTKDPDLVRDPENAGLPSISHNGTIIVSVFEVGLAF